MVHHRKKIGSLSLVVMMFIIGLAHGQSAAEKKEAAKPKITDPAVLAILESKPTTPAEQFRSVQLLADLQQPDLARSQLKKLMEANLDDNALAALAEKFGTAEFMQFARTESLAPEAAQFADAVIAAAARVTRDPAKLKAFVAQLTGEDQVAKEDAIIGLARAGSAAVWPLFIVLDDNNRAEAHPIVRAMILRLKSSAVGPLISILDSPDVSQQRLAIALLSQLPAEKAIPSLAAIYAKPSTDEQNRAAAADAIELISGAKPTPADARRLLELLTKQQLDHSRLIDSQDNYGDVSPSRSVWRWNAQEGRPVEVTEPEANIIRSEALKTARALLSTDPKNAIYQQLFLTALLEDAKHRNGLDRPLTADVFSQVADVGLDATDNVLRDALENGNTATAIGAAEVLGKLGSSSLIARADGKPIALADAAKSGDRRVSFAAIEAILNLRPLTPFAGASAVGEGLKFFAGTSGFRRALVADPRAAVAQQLASYLSQMGYETDIATNGRDAFKLATNSPDYELALIHAAIDRPRADDLVAQLRKDSRTAKLPIGIIALPEHPESAERLARGTPLSTAIAEPQDAAALKQQVERLLNKPGCAPVPLDVRRQQAAWSISALAQLAENPLPWLNARSISRSVEHSLYAPGMTAPVVSLLANAGTATGQSELVQLAARESLPLPTRELAALAFAKSVAKHGILLTKDQILNQYDTYNRNAGQNRDTHKVMLTILEAIDPTVDEKDPVTD